jgi:hypothetical protein
VHHDADGRGWCAGAGLNPRFGAPEWRIVFGIELFNHHTKAR